MEKITSYEMKALCAEYERIQAEEERLSMIKHSVVTTAILTINRKLNHMGLGFRKLDDALCAYVDGNIDDMRFKIVDRTIRDIFYLDDSLYKFDSIAKESKFGYGFRYSRDDKIISIEIPAFPHINADDALDVDATKFDLNWGCFKVYSVETSIKHNICCDTLNIIADSDSVMNIVTAIRKYFEGVQENDNN